MSDRHVTKYLYEAIRAVPVVVLEGGRAVGKSTLCEPLATQHGWAKPTDLSDPAVLETVALDPDRRERSVGRPVHSGSDVVADRIRTG